MCIVRCYSSTHKFCIIVSILLIKLTFIQQSKRNAACMETNLFRFKDLDPRIYHIHYSNMTFKPTIPFSYGRNLGELNHKNQTQKTNSNLDRESRGFLFHSTGEDTEVDVEFTIPFIRVPITGGINLTKSTMRNLLNLRTGSLLWAGAFLTVGTLIAGTLNSIGALKPAFFPLNGHKKRMRHVRRQNDFDSLDNYIETSTTLKENSNDVGTLLDEKLLEHNIDLNSCIKSLICGYIKNAADDVRSGKASATQKILDGFAKTQFLLQYFSGTAVQTVIEAGRNSNCYKWKWRCTSKFPNIETNDIVYLISKYFNGY